MERIPIAVPTRNFGTHFPRYKDRGARGANKRTPSERRDSSHTYEVPALAGIAGFALGHVYYDIMHTLDLGVYQVVVCSALTELVQAGAGVFMGFVTVRRLAVATADYLRWCRRNKVKHKCRKLTQRLVTGPCRPYR